MEPSYGLKGIDPYTQENGTPRRSERAQPRARGCVTAPMSQSSSLAFPALWLSWLLPKSAPTSLGERSCQHTSVPAPTPVLTLVHAAQHHVTVTEHRLPEGPSRQTVITVCNSWKNSKHRRLSSWRRPVCPSFRCVCPASATAQGAPSTELWPLGGNISWTPAALRRLQTP